MAGRAARVMIELKLHFTTTLIIRDRIRQIPGILLFRSRIRKIVSIGRYSFPCASIVIPNLHEHIMSRISFIITVQSEVIRSGRHIFKCKLNIKARHSGNFRNDHERIIIEMSIDIRSGR